MERDHESAPQLSPNEVLGIADAIDERNHRRGVTARKIEAELMGVPYIETPQKLRDAQSVTRTAFLISHLENLDKPFDIQGYATANEADGLAFEVEAAKVMATRGSEGPSPEAMRQLRDAMLKSAADAGFDDERLASEMRRDLRACREVADANGLNIVDVFTTDKLYHQAMRQEYPLEEHLEIAATVVTAIEADSENKVVNIMLAQELTPAEIETMSVEERAEILEDMRATEGFAEAVGQFSFMYSECFRQNFYVYTGAVYGESAYDAITPEQRERFLPRMPLASAVTEALAEAAA